MQKYHFKLQPLLKKERIYEDECARKLKTIHDEYQGESNKLEKYLKSENKCQEELNTKRQQQISPSQLMAYEGYFMKIEDEIGDGKRKLKEIADRFRDAQNELALAMKKRKALEKLKERKQEEHENELSLMLNKEMDEMAMIKFIRDKGVGN